MNRTKSALLLLVYLLTLLLVTVSTNACSFVPSSSENAEKETITNSTFEHRESSSIKIRGKLGISNQRRAPAPGNFRLNIHSKLPAVSYFKEDAVPIYVMQCIYRL